MHIAHSQNIHRFLYPSGIVCLEIAFLKKYLIAYEGKSRSKFTRQRVLST